MKPYDSSTYEVKRVFVKTEYRGNGISKLLMGKLEAKAIEKNIEFLMLETSAVLVAAIHLYHNLGY